MLLSDSQFKYQEALLVQQCIEAWVFVGNIRGVDLMPLFQHVSQRLLVQQQAGCTGPVTTRRVVSTRLTGAARLM
jgi:hypothetical protein